MSTVKCCPNVRISASSDLDSFYQTTYTQDGLFTGPGAPSSGDWPVYRHDGDSEYYLARIYTPGYTYGYRWKIGKDSISGLPHIDVNHAYAWLSTADVPCPRFISNGRNIDSITIECITSKISRRDYSESDVNYSNYT